MSIDIKEQEIKSSTRKFVWIGILFLIFGFCGFLLWASTVKIAQGVVAPGTVVPEGRRIAIQHQYGGTIKEIFVKDGDSVKKGDRLIALDDTQVKARFQSIRIDYMTFLAIRSRLISERLDRGSIQYDPEFLKEKSDRGIAEIIKTQNELFQNRRNSYKNEINVLQKQKDGLTRYVEELNELIKAKKKQIELISKEIDNLKSVADEGYYPKQRISEYQRIMSQYQVDLREQSAVIERTKASIIEIDARIAQVENQYKKEIDTQLTDVEKNILNLKEQYNALKQQLEMMVITSPVDGVILDLAYNSVGGVINPGQKIMDIVPSNKKLIIEAMVSPHDIAEVHIGQETEVRFSALNTKNTPSIFGQVIFVSSDALYHPTTRQPYYLVKIDLNEKELHKLEGKHLFPGLPAEMVIRTRERTLLEYYVKPLLYRLHFSMREK